MKLLSVLLLLAVVGCDTYEIHVKEVVDTVYADTLYDTVYVATQHFNNAHVTLLYNSVIEGNFQAQVDSIGYFNVSHCDFDIVVPENAWDRQHYMGAISINNNRIAQREKGDSL